MSFDDSVVGACQKGIYCSSRNDSLHCLLLLENSCRKLHYCLQIGVQVKSDRWNNRDLITSDLSYSEDKQMTEV